MKNKRNDNQSEVDSTVINYSSIYEDLWDGIMSVAIAIATEAHKDQKRKDGSPYIDHAIRVMESMPVYSVQRIAAVLHDVLEDCPEWNMKRLEDNGIPRYIVQLVDILTHKDQIPYLDYILLLKEDEQAKEIKLADIADNLNGATGTLRDKYMMAKYILEH